IGAGPLTSGRSIGVVGGGGGGGAGTVVLADVAAGIAGAPGPAVTSGGGSAAGGRGGLRGGGRGGWPGAGGRRGGGNRRGGNRRGGRTAQIDDEAVGPVKGIDAVTRHAVEIDHDTSRVLRVTSEANLFHDVVVELQRRVLEGGDGLHVLQIEEQS